MWPSGDLQKIKRLRREAGEWEEEAENELKQNIITINIIFSGAGKERMSRRESEMGLMKYRSEMVSPFTG